MKNSICKEGNIHFVGVSKKYHKKLFDTISGALYSAGENFKYKKNVDIAIFEVGIGGLNDITNLFSPTISAITNVALDHCEILGNKTPLEAAKTPNLDLIAKKSRIDYCFTVDSKGIK